MLKNDAVVLGAPMTKRFMAFIVDWYISSLFAMMPIIIAQSLQNRSFVIINRVDTLSLESALVAVFFSLLIYMIYFCVIPLTQGKKRTLGQTLGRRLFKITVGKIDAGKLTFPALFIRDVIGVLLLQGVLTSCSIYIMSIVQMILKTDVVPYFESIYYSIALISLLMFFLGKRKQTLHDYISKTIVLECK